MRKNAKLPKVIARRIAKYRKLKGLTQEELAEKVHMSRVFIGYIEQGRNTTTVETLQKIARALGIKVTELME